MKHTYLAQVDMVLRICQKSHHCYKDRVKDDQSCYEGYASQIGTATRAYIHPAGRYIAWRRFILGLLELQVDRLQQVWANHGEDR